LRLYPGKNFFTRFYQPAFKGRTQFEKWAKKNLLGTTAKLFSRSYLSFVKKTYSHLFGAVGVII
jgi:hypothetical protein